MNILALDIATKTGYAYNLGDTFISGTTILALPKEIKQWGEYRLTRRLDPRCFRMYVWLATLLHTYKIDLVVFEDIQFASTTLACQLWASLRAAVWLACEDTNTLTDCVSATTLKKFATGKGNADKATMGASLKKLHPDKWNEKLSEDATDAIWIWLWAKQNYENKTQDRGRTAGIDTGD